MTLPLVCMQDMGSLDHFFDIDPDDYRTTSTLLTFGPAATTRQVSILITTNGVNEPTEQFQALLTLLTTGVDVTIRPSEATVFIEDDDGKFIFGRVAHISCSCCISRQYWLIFS